MALKNFRVTNGISIESSGIPTSIIQETVTSNSATTVDTVALNSFISCEYTVTLAQGSKVRTSKVFMQTDGTSVDMTEFGIIETGGTMSGVVISATTASTNAILQLTVTDASSTIVRYKIVKNILSSISYIPDAPTIGTATQTGYTTATVAFTAPIDNGGQAISSFTATSSPGFITGSGSSSPVSVSGLQQATNYTFVVTATNSNGTSTESSSSNEITTPQAPPTVSGGTLYSGDATYYYRKFTAGGTLTISGGPLSFECICVAGGGGGGNGPYRSGGGGAGGLKYNSITNLAAEAYTVLVGAGGSPGSSSTQGSNSSIKLNSTVISEAIGGGRGGGTVVANSTTDPNRHGGNGGSGGGAAYSGTAGSGISGQGNAGSIPGFVTTDTGGGGVCAGGAATFGAQAGVGSLVYSSWATATSSGVNGYFAGGGNGYFDNNNNAGYQKSPADGGGTGNGARSSGSGPGTAFSGGGGGGGWSINAGDMGGAGGSGIVIVKYLKTAVLGG